MDAATRQELAELRKLSSQQAADLILARCPTDGEGWGVAITLIAHLSWKVPDQIRLAEHYLSELPHANGRAYETFAKMMQLELLLPIIERNWPQDPKRVGLLLYYLIPALRSVVQNDRQSRLVAEWLERMDSEKFD